MRPVEGLIDSLNLPADKWTKKVAFILFLPSGGRVRRRATALAACAVALAMLAGCAVPERQALDVRLQGEGSSAAEALGIAAPLSEAPPLPETPSLEDYLGYAEQNNPALAAARARWAAAVERVVGERTLPDPMLRFETDLRVGPAGYGVGVEQVFPWAGKLALRGQAAWEDAEAARQRYEAEKWKLFRMVKDAYYEYYYLGRQIGVVRDQRQVLQHMEEALRTRYSASEAGYSDVIRAQVELGKMDNDLRTLVDLQGPVAARLNSLLNRPPDAVVPWPAETAPEDLRIAEDEALQRFRQSNPELAALEHEIAAGQRGVELAQRDYYPDVTVGLEFIEASRKGQFGMGPGEKDPLVAMVSVNLPVWREKLRAGVRGAEARHREAMYARRDMENQLAAEIKMVLYQLRDADRRIDLYRDTLVPKGEQSVRASQTAFLAGTGTFLDVLDAVRILLEFELQYQRALADRGMSMGRLEELLGTPIVGPAGPAGHEAPSPEQEAPTAGPSSAG
jgi:cobalt-zinc-cadmium efflux system outer membrane protein